MEQFRCSRVDNDFRVLFGSKNKERYNGDIPIPTCKISHIVYQVLQGTAAEWTT